MSGPRRRGTSRSTRRKPGPGGRSGRGRGGPRRTITITSVSPAGDVRDSSPTVQATVQDREGRLSRHDIYVYIDGQEARRFDYNRSTGSLRCQTWGLSKGSHTVGIEVSADEGRRTARKSWSLIVK